MSETIHAPAGAACSRCDSLAAYHCEDCGKPICPQHVVLRGGLSRLRETCGSCLGEVSLSLAPPPLPEAPVSAGTFAKVRDPKTLPRQPWATKHDHRPTGPVIATRVVEQPETTFSKRMKAAVSERNRCRDRGVHRGQQGMMEIAQRDAREARADAAWIKNQIREIGNLLVRDEVVRALALVDALAGLPTKMRPSVDEDLAREWIAGCVTERLEWLAGPQSPLGPNARWRSRPPRSPEGNQR